TPRFVDCYFSATSSATVFTASATPILIGCVITGGGIGITSSTLLTVMHCLFLSCGSHCIQTTGGSQGLIHGNSVYGEATGGFYNITTAVPSVAMVSDNEVWGMVNGVNNSTGTNTNLIAVVG